MTLFYEIQGRWVQDDENSFLEEHTLVVFFVFLLASFLRETFGGGVVLFYTLLTPSPCVYLCVQLSQVDFDYNFQFSNFKAISVFDVFPKLSLFVRMMLQQKLIVLLTTKSNEMK